MATITRQTESEKRASNEEDNLNMDHQTGNRKGNIGSDDNKSNKQSDDSKSSSQSDDSKSNNSEDDEMEKDRIVVGGITVIYHTNVILVKSKNNKWIFPKGARKKLSGEDSEKGQPIDELPNSACEREAFEEAGIVGTAELEPFITKRNIDFFIIKIHEVLEEYPECKTRERRLFKMEEALRDGEVANYVKEIIKEFIKRKIETFSEDSSII